MGRNRRKKKRKATATGRSGEGEEDVRGLEEPLLPNANSSTPRSPVSIPKPRTPPPVSKTPPATDLVAAAFDEAPSEETLVEPLLRRDAPSSPPRRRSRDGEVRLSVTFQEPLPFQFEEGEGSDARPSDSSDDEAEPDASSPSSNASFSPRKELAEIWRLGWPMGV